MTEALNPSPPNRLFKAINVVNSKVQFTLKAFEPLSLHDRFNIITSCVAAIIVVLAFVLSLEYGFHPVGNFVQLKSYFALSLPLIICKQTGAFAAIFLIIQVCRKRVLVSFERGIASLVFLLGALPRLALHPIGRSAAAGEEGIKYLGKHFAEMDNAGAHVEPWEFATFKDRDGLTLRGLWHFLDREAPTVILFHGNAMEAYQMLQLWGPYYRDKNYNILSFEYRGYGISEGITRDCDQEINAFKDAEAALKFVLDQGIDKDKIVAHGYSLGGAYAAILALFGVKKIILNHTFKSLSTCAENVLKGFSPSLISECVKRLYSSKKLPAHEDIEGAIELETDNWDSLEKVKKADPSVDFFVLYGIADTLMDPEWMPEFLKTRYSTQEERDAHLAGIAGGHIEVANFYSDNEAKAKLNAFLDKRRSQLHFLTALI